MSSKTATLIWSLTVDTTGEEGYWTDDMVRELLLDILGDQPNHALMDFIDVEEGDE